MKIEHIPKQPLDYDPFDFDICGSHPGEALHIDCGGMKLTIQETESGLGPSLKISAAYEGQQSGNLWAFVDDNGELNFFLTEKGT